MRYNNNSNNRFTKKIFKLSIIGFILSIIFLIVLLILGNKIKNTSAGIYFDEVIISTLHRNISPYMKEFMKVISFLGSAKFYIILCILMIAFFIKRKTYMNIVALLSGVLGSFLLNLILKNYYGRIRPEAYFLVNETGFSFPSAHSMVAISSYGILAYLLMRNRTWNNKKKLLWILTGLLIILIGFSRVYLGVHWPTDIIGGFGAGFIWLYLNIIILERINLKINSH
ncbi:phosphatidic acid phosphatase domain-containing protein, PAP2 family [Gottschalkia purinilytica]|uniref:Phosphatidic acid phosphatase domain-containing protein, PAP2 family n=1 Tax=Gottschalkia purinilytica TaxID=1503 RepID=A0A0L0W934_GOTPU|nr:phosphatase PAP2 family protein [Gottschalkia purinilytica]KNF08058.1 phosphatidic acid phosphatase domain-containing protein, PAP2 family [Gottschalkia purinilytica]